MIIDKNLQVASAQVVTANAASADVIDLGATQQAIGPGECMWLMTAIRAVSGTAPTLTVAIQTADDAAFTTPVTIASATMMGTIAAGQRIAVAVPQFNKRFMRAFYTVGGTSPSFTVDTFLADDDPPSWAAFPDALTVP